MFQRVDNIMVFPHWGGQKSNLFLSSKSSQRYLNQNSNFVNFRCCYFNLLWTSNKKLWRFFLNGGSFTSPKIILLKHKENNNNNICILCHILCFTHKFYNKWFDILPSCKFLKQNLNYCDYTLLLNYMSQ